MQTSSDNKTCNNNSILSITVTNLYRTAMCDFFMGHSNSNNIVIITLTTSSKVILGTSTVRKYARVLFNTNQMKEDLYICV